MELITGSPMMTTSEIAKALNVSTETVRANGKKLFPELFANGKQTFFNEVQATAVKMEIEKHHNLQSTLELPKTDLEKELLIAQAMQFQHEKIQVLQQQFAIAAPKIEFYDAVTGSSDTIDIGEAAKVLAIPGLGRNNLFAKLREKGVLMGNNQPYQKHIDAGHFRQVESKFVKPDGTTCINIKTVVYQKGLEYIRKIVQ